MSTNWQRRVDVFREIVSVTEGVGDGVIGRTDPVYMDGLVIWSIVGRRLFAGYRFPTRKKIAFEVTRAALAVALGQDPTITGAARLLHMSRKALRDNMMRTGIYPWPGM